MKVRANENGVVDLTGRSLDDDAKKLRNVLNDKIVGKLFNHELTDYTTHCESNREGIVSTLIEQAMSENKFDFVLRDNSFNGVVTINHDGKVILGLSSFNDWTISDLREVLDSVKAKKSAKAKTE